jgi:hypothetical protein
MHQKLNSDLEIDDYSLAFCKRYESEFAIPYFQYLVSIENFTRLLELPAAYDKYLENFFKQKDEMRQYRWMYELKCRRYATAAKLLSANLETSSDGFLQKSLLSMAKLCYVAAWEENEIESGDLDGLIRGIY